MINNSKYLDLRENCVIFTERRKKRGIGKILILTQIDQVNQIYTQPIIP